jgi:DNA polymerase I-like protein with 3'-5' exonuclease and polymerase domains
MNRRGFQWAVTHGLAYRKADDPAEDGPEVEVIRRENQLALEERILSFDFAAFERRVLAWARDNVMTDDIHKLTAAATFGVPAEQVTPEMRRLGKVLNYALSFTTRSGRLNYVRDEFARALNLRIQTNEAKSYSETLQDELEPLP